MAIRQRGLVFGHGTCTLHLIITLLLLASWLFVTADAACYYPNGGLAPNDVPCRSNTIAAACCGQGYACLSNGICQATGNELLQPGASEFVRGSCSDKSWSNPGCPYFCIDPQINNIGGGHGIAKCRSRPDDTYYCIDSKHDETTCVKGGFLFFSGQPQALTTVGVTPSATSTTSSTSSITTRSSTSSEPTSGMTTSTTSTMTSSPTPSPTSPGLSSPDSPKDNTALIAGVVAGVLGGLILGAAGIWLLRRFLQRRKDARGNNPPAGAATAGGASDLPVATDNSDLSKPAAATHHYYQQQHGYGGSWPAAAGQKSELDAGGHGISNSMGGSAAVYEAEAMRSPQELHADPAGWR